MKQESGQESGQAAGQASGRRNDDQAGVAIIISLVFVVIVAGLVFSSATMLDAQRDRSEVRFRVEAQATQFARAGLTDGLNWFRRQTSQPVTSLNPVLDTDADPQILETDDPELGIMREFQIEGNIFGRYEVWKQWDADPDPKRLAWRQQYQCVDITGERGLSGAGNVWSVASVGYVFIRRDPNLPFNVKPNRVVSSVVLGTEVRRLTLLPPTQGAISVGDGNGAHINTNGRLRGGATGAGIYYPTGSGTPTVGPPGDQRVIGSPPLLLGPSYDDSVEAVFGVGENELRAMADLVITDPADFPNPVPTNSLVFVDVPNLMFDAAKPLMGSGVVYIKGNTSIVSGSNSMFSGLLYVDGSFTMRAPSEINGSVVVTGNFTIQGAGDFATINYDDDVLSAMRNEIGQYRLSTAIRDLRSGDGR